MSDRETERKPGVVQGALMLGVVALLIYGAFILLVHLRGGA